MRKPGELVANYIAELQALSQYFNFGDTLKPMLRDRIVYGIYQVQTQKGLLVEKELTFAKAKEIVLGQCKVLKTFNFLQVAQSIMYVVKKKTTSYI